MTVHHKRPPKSQLVWIVWQDAVAESTRSHVDELKDCKLVRNTNLGWIEHENEERIVLTHGFSTSGERDHFVIPKRDILERIPVVAARKRNPET